MEEGAAAAEMEEMEEEEETELMEERRRNNITEDNTPLERTRNEVKVLNENVKRNCKSWHQTSLGRRGSRFVHLI